MKKAMIYITEPLVMMANDCFSHMLTDDLSPTTTNATTTTTVSQTITLAVAVEHYHQEKVSRAKLDAECHRIRDKLDTKAG